MQTVLEAEATTTPTETNGQMLLEETADETKPEVVKLPGVPTEEIAVPTTPPTAEEIHQAIKTLTSLQANAGGEVSEGEHGDIFLCYDLCMRVRGEKDLHITDRRILHRILLPEGLPSATSDMEAALYSIIQPFKQHLMGIIGRQTALTHGDIPKRILNSK